MNRPLLLLSSGLVLALTLSGCPDTRQSRDPQTMADIAELRGDMALLHGELQGIKAELEAVKATNSEGQGVNIHQHFHGTTPLTGTGQPATLAPAGGGNVTGTLTVEATPIGPSAPETGSASTGSTQPASSGTQHAGKPPTTQEVERQGFDSWNELNPRQPNETPTRGGAVRVHLRSEPDLLNTYLDNSAVTSWMTAYMQETLIDRNPQTFEWEPLLAESWDTEDMLFEIVGQEPISGVKFVQAMQMWVKGPEEQPDQTWYPWEIRELSGGAHELLHLEEHIGLASSQGRGWILEQGGQHKLFAGDKVAGVNKGTVFTFHLRKGVRFHDGKPFTADDVVFTLGFIKCEYVKAPSTQSYYADVRPAEKIDDHTVRIVYATQYFKALSFAGGITVHPRHYYDPENLLQNDPKAFGDWFNEADVQRKPLGTGPYRFDNWKNADSMTMTRNDDYWNPAEGGYLDTIVWKFISEAQTALASLKADELDFVPELSPEQYFQETDTPAFTQRFVKPQYYTGGYSYVGWNTRKPMFSDQRVRLALAHGAVDVPKFIRDVRYGAAVQIAGSQYIFGSAYDRSVQPYPFNPKKARQLLREAGWFDRDGDGVIENADRTPFEFEFLVPSGSSTGRPLAALMVENLQELGIKMSVRELEWATFINNIKSRSFDACTLGWAQPEPEGDPFQLWHSSNSENEGSNHTGFVFPEADRMIMGIRSTLDPKERLTLHYDFQRFLYGQQPYLFLYCPSSLAAYKPTFHGVRLHSIPPGYDLKEWYLAE